MKRLLHIALAATLLAACGTKENQEDKTNNPEKTPGKTVTPVAKVAPDGDYIENYPDGKVKIQGEMKNGTRNGTWQAFYPEGNKQSEIHYEDGKKNGKSATFYPNGRIRYVGYYKWDEPTGTWEFYDEAGNLATTKEYK